MNKQIFIVTQKQVMRVMGSRWDHRISSDELIAGVEFEALEAGISLSPAEVQSIVDNFNYAYDEQGLETVYERVYG